MSEKSPTFSVRVRGELACFTRPEFKVERVSYEVMTPSAARGIVEAIFWKPAIRWVIERIHVLAPIRFISFKRNEVASKIKVSNVLQEVKGKTMTAYYADEDREQRNTIALRDVDYVVEAHYVPTAQWSSTDNLPKYNDMFRRRLEHGQTYHHPYLGCREFGAMVEGITVLSQSRLPEEQRNKALGWMLYDLEFTRQIRPLFFEARLVNGVLEVPALEAIQASNDEAGRNQR